MRSSESIQKISKALSKFQEKVKNPANTATNPFFDAKYAPLPDILNVVRPLLAEHGLSVVQMPSGDGENVVITTLLLHESGEWIESCPLTLKADKVTAQGAGSAITYGRRYSLAAMLGISSEDDDDGNAASGSQKPQQARGQKKQRNKTNTPNPQGKFFAKLKEWGDKEYSKIPHEIIEETTKSVLRERLKVESCGEIKDKQWAQLCNKFNNVVNAVSDKLGVVDDENS